jgi:hypothetical protein
MIPYILFAKEEIVNILVFATTSGLCKSSHKPYKIDRAAVL